MRILILANFGMGLYNFRKELIEEFIKQKHEVFISLPNDEYVSRLEKMGCEFIDTPVDRRGTNPLSDLKLFFKYMKIIRGIRPDIVLTYTIKANVYGGIACGISKVPYLANVTGLGTSIENKGVIQKITLILYKLGLKKASCVFFQNKTNRKFFLKNRIVRDNTELIPGSGVNLEEHKFEEYPATDKKIRFLFIGRIMKAKGIDELLKAAEIIKQDYPNVDFDLVGGVEENYIDKLNELQKNKIITYHGQQKDVHSFIKHSHATILPSYHEGLANVLLESASSGRPVLASRIPGCIETFEEEKNGLGFDVKNVESLVKVIKKFINLPYSEKKSMGISARQKVEKEFNREIVIDAYMDKMNRVIGRGD